jgi:hypothetical protein
VKLECWLDESDEGSMNPMAKLIAMPVGVLVPVPLAAEWFYSG